MNSFCYLLYKSDKNGRDTVRLLYNHQDLFHFNHNSELIFSVVEHVGLILTYHLQEEMPLFSGYQHLSFDNGM